MYITFFSLIDNMSHLLNYQRNFFAGQSAFSKSRRILYVLYCVVAIFYIRNQNGPPQHPTSGPILNSIVPKSESVAM
jgi:hypothetical protein